ncbi:MAG TPA: HAMP domain-containing sensor histidine kinase [Planctomycetota bacterium]|nr:HAMP domain-containing sensor histidine kinase [Planctomycetota bacterium]
MPRRLLVPSIEPFASPVEGLLALCRWFIRLRWLAALALFGIVGATRWIVGIRLPLAQLFCLGAVLVCYNILFKWYNESLCARPHGAVSRRAAEHFANAQVFADLLCMTVLLHFSGGVENPLSVFYVFHVIIASVVLPRRQSYGHAAVALGLFAALVFLEYAGAVPHYQLEGYLSWPQYQNGGFIFGHLGALAVTLFVSAFMATSIVARLRERQTELAATTGRLTELEARKSRFMRVAAHQLRSPLSAIHSLLAIATRSYAGLTEEKRLDMIRRAENRTRLMLDLLSELLALSRLRDARDQKPERALMTLDEVAARVVALFGAQAEEKRQTLDVRLAAPRAQIYAETEQLRDVLANLVSNAIKYTPEGGRVTVASRTDEASVVFEVTDTGIGIPLEDQPHLFEEFFRAHNARALFHEGTGLGLSIVREIVEAYDGQIAFDSQPGQGTRFTVTFPLATCPLPGTRNPEPES